MQWLQHNIVWIGLVLAIIAIFFIIAHLTKNATIHEEKTYKPATGNEADRENPDQAVTLASKADPLSQQFKEK